MQTKVLLVEDHEIVRQGIKALLQGNPQVVVTGEASNGEEALEKISASQPDLILMDMNMPVMNGLDCTKLVKKQFPSIKVLILSMHNHENYLIDMLDAGADGYILKNSSKDELLFAIKKIANNGVYIGSEFTLGMLAKFKAENKSNMLPKINLALSDREKDVLTLIADGLTNAEIAGKLFTSIRTIETRRKRLLEKTGTTNTATLIRFAVKNGLIS
jgi:DNA-binding NarL/FixJ family response regulator